MIGNDVIDLNLAQERNILRSRFLNKVFSQREQMLIFDAVQPMQKAWLLWSMKESAYKLYVQGGGVSRFNPIDFSCALYSDTSGFVQYRGELWYTNSEIAENYILSEASSESGKSKNRIPYIFKSKAYQNQHIELYDHAKKEFSKIYKINSNDISILKNRLGVPQVYFSNHRQNISLSLSHHGRYGAIAWG